MRSRQAQCSCGRLNITVEGDPIRVSACHCKACQRRTGSACGVQARFPEGNVQIIGAYKQYTRTSDDGNRVDSFFCPDCGSTLFLRLEHAPDMLVIPVGAFGDSGFPSPTVSIYEAHRHAWFCLEGQVEHID